MSGEKNQWTRCCTGLCGSVPPGLGRTPVRAPHVSAPPRLWVAAWAHLIGIGERVALAIVWRLWRWVPWPTVAVGTKASVGSGSRPTRCSPLVYALSIGRLAGFAGERGFCMAGIDVQKNERQRSKIDGGPQTSTPSRNAPPGCPSEHVLGPGRPADWVAFPSEPEPVPADSSFPGRGAEHARAAHRRPCLQKAPPPITPRGQPLYAKKKRGWDGGDERITRTMCELGKRGETKRRRKEEKEKKKRRERKRDFSFSNSFIFCFPQARTTCMHACKQEKRR